MPEPVIVVDDAIAHADQAFAELGRVELLPSARIDGPRLAELGAEALIVRSVTRVDEELLAAATELRFVATATAGVDHLDQPALYARGIAPKSAAGCNARAVAEWVAAALLLVGDRLPPAIAAGPVGLVGYGNVGSRLAALLRGLGREVLACDPPLERGGMCPEPFFEFETLWRRCPIVSFHVPLSSSTRAMLDGDHPAPAGPKLIINTSRGDVIAEAALAREDLVGLILDVWPGEPRPAPQHLGDPRILLASPHVAGYSLEAKIAATRMMHEALARWRRRPPSWTGAQLLPPLELARAEDLRAYLRQAIDFDGDDARVRALAELPDDARGPAFEALRRGYALRREFRAYSLPRCCTGETRTTLAQLGFRRGKSRPVTSF